MKKLKIAIIFGGCSEEHDISVKSACEIADNIDMKKYEPVYVGITKAGAWKTCERPCRQWDNDNCYPAVISPDKKTRGLIIFRDGKLQTQAIDVVFPVLHGRSGEDGTIQGLLELSGIPYVGCDTQSSVLGMDKSLAYMVVKNAGIPTPDFTVLYPGDTPKINRFPVFVKPARSGSSFGVTKVLDSSELDFAIELARQYDNKVLIEQGVLGSEVGCAILESDSGLQAGEVDQITLSHGIFRIHQEANPEEGSENAVFTVPADLPLEKRREIQETAISIYTALGCRGLARVDMFLQGNGRIIFNEINTLPGFTSYSRYPRMMKASGIDLPKIIEHLISRALKG